MDYNGEEGEHQRRWRCTGREREQVTGEIEREEMHRPEVEVEREATTSCEDERQRGMVVVRVRVCGG